MSYVGTRRAHSVTICCTRTHIFVFREKEINTRVIYFTRLPKSCRVLLCQKKIPSTTDINDDDKGEGGGGGGWEDPTTAAVALRPCQQGLRFCQTAPVSRMWKI
jgi:hypothetical protein